MSKIIIIFILIMFYNLFTIAQIKQNNWILQNFINKMSLKERFADLIVNDTLFILNQKNKNPICFKSSVKNQFIKLVDIKYLIENRIIKFFTMDIKYLKKNKIKIIFWNELQRLQYFILVDVEHSFKIIKNDVFSRRVFGLNLTLLRCIIEYILYIQNEKNINTLLPCFEVILLKKDTIIR